MSFTSRHLNCPLERALFKGEGSSGGSNKTCREPLYLVALDRYKADSESKRLFPEVSPYQSFLYDATITDGDCRIRAMLHPRLGQLVRVNELRCGSELHRAEFTVEFDEKRLGPGRVKFQLVGAEVENGPEGPVLQRLRGQSLAALPWLRGDGGVGGLALAPLKARRSCYLPLWNCEDYFGDIWKKKPPSTEPANNRARQGSSSLRFITLRQARTAFINNCRRNLGTVGNRWTLGNLRTLGNRWTLGNLGTVGNLGTLLVRVMKKSRLRHYGRVQQNSECPYQAEFQVADRSGSASMILWNSLCLNWFICLEPGIVLKLQNYRVKATYSSRMGTGQESEDQIEIEINLNSQNPSAIISIIPEEAVQTDWKLPSLTFKFHRREKLDVVPNGTICDVIGLVTFVGRPERVLKKGGDFNEFSVYRWVYMEDGSGDAPIVLKLESTSQPELHTQLHPMLVLVCTNVQLTSTSNKAELYVTSTTNSHVYRRGQHRGRPYTTHPKVVQFIQWLKTLSEKEEVTKIVLGGYFSFPPLPSSVEQYLEERNGEACLSSMEELKGHVYRLQYQQHRRFTVQATIIAVCYCPLGQEEVCSPPRQMNVQPNISSDRSPEIPSQARQSSMKRPLEDPGTVSTAPVKRPSLPPRSKAMQEVLTPPSSRSSTVKVLDTFCNEFEDEELVAALDEYLEESNPLVWCGRRWHGERLGGMTALPETVPRYGSYNKLELHTQAAGLQPACFEHTLSDPVKTLESFPSSIAGYYRFTILGLNESLAIETIFIPTKHLSLSPEPYENSLASILVHGGFSPSTPCPTPEELIASASELAHQHFLFVLDISSQGVGRLEVVLNRAYPCPTLQP
ncbi:RPA-related protein RADX-like [Polyodon spathula]|uniref:RPA-related protein RADX-like n=1 Tax=Polyodon spathula TaxID=7913 RepID=UPI001B7DC7A0|nr:RPA-related protein RADX-like [Polyodon spathula]